MEGRKEGKKRGREGGREPEEYTKGGAEKHVAVG